MWNVTPKEAIEIQKALREKVNIRPFGKPVTLIGGCDMSMNMFAKDGYAGFVVLDFKTLEMVDHEVVKDSINFPYIPGLLSFREIPMLLKAWEKLQTKPDVLIVDGVGIAHPRRLGIATHLGLELNIPTIGCSKSILYGTYEEPGNTPGDFSCMHDPKNGEVIGAVIRTKKNVKPVFVSPGNMVSVEEAIDIVRACVRKHRLPEPTRAAHNTMNAYRIKE